MYKLHLILKYLRKRRIAWVSLVAVMLCTALVIVVISVMGGWLRMFRASFQGLAGDVMVSGYSLTGFPHYEEMIDEIRRLPSVDYAIPTIETFGLVNIDNKIRRGVQVVGYPTTRPSDPSDPRKSVMANIGAVNRFPESLYLQYQRLIDRADDPKSPLSPQDRARLREIAERNRTSPSFDLPLPPESYRARFPNAREDVTQWPGLIGGVGVLGARKDSDGRMTRGFGEYGVWVKVTTLAITPGSASIDVAADKGERNFWLVDDSRTQVWQADQATVYVPFEVLQADLRMNGQPYIDAATGEERLMPARTQNIQIGLKPGADLYAAKSEIQRVVAQIRERRQISEQYPIAVETWEETQATFINAIEKEKLLVTFLFAMISVVAVFLIFCIFYMIVVEKTKDIGIIKAVGATSTGVASIFLGYGLAIGLVGSGLGLVVGGLIVTYINEIHTAMGRFLGVQIWNPEVYAFETIPNTMDATEVAVIILFAIVSSVAGATVPAIRAARLHPVEALRFE